MPIEAKQSSEFDFTVSQVAVPHPITGSKSGYFMNIREDNGEILGATSERYAVVNNADLLDKADEALDRRGIGYNRNVYVTDGGRKLRAVYDLEGENFQVAGPQVGDVMSYRLTVQNSFDRTLRISFALGLMRLICTNGMQTMEKDVDMVSKHSRKLSLDSLITEEALDKSLASLSRSTDVFHTLAGQAVPTDTGLNILANLTAKKIISDKVRERVASIWANRDQLLRSNDTDGNLYNLYNAVTQHLTDEVEGSRFEYANSISSNVLKNFRAASLNPKRLKTLTAVPENSQVVVTE